MLFFIYVGGGVKLYQINLSNGMVIWCANKTEAISEAKLQAIKEMSTTGVAIKYDITPVTVPLLKPQFLDWINNNFGGYQNV